MKNSIVSRKVIASILATVLLAFGIQGIGYCQVEVDTTDIDITGLDIVTVDPELSVNQIYHKAIRSVVWILTPDGGEASGVLIDAELRLVVTNEHVTKDNESVLVFFPVRDKDGKLIEERTFYASESNLGVLARLGYATTGRVVAKDPETDLAIVELEGLPETAREVDYEFSYSAHRYMDKNDSVHVLGNPGRLKLWRWTAGFFQEVAQDGGKEVLYINADTYKGNSGGPVLNSRGMLIGIVSKSNLLMYTVAIPTQYINELLKTLGPRRIFSIQNNTRLTVHYQIKWKESELWKPTSIKPDSVMNHWFGSLEDIPQGYPKIRFDYIANDQEVTYRNYRLQTYTRRLGSNVTPSRRKDAREYHFEYNFVTEILDLHDSEKK